MRNDRPTRADLFVDFGSIAIYAYSANDNVFRLGQLCLGSVLSWAWSVSPPTKTPKSDFRYPLGLFRLHAMLNLS